MQSGGGPSDAAVLPMPPSPSSPLVARTGRALQRYEDGHRLLAGCVPFRRKRVSPGEGVTGKEELEVLLITSQGGKGLLFPKGGWETDETVEEAALREAMEEAGVRGTLECQLGIYDFHSKRRSEGDQRYKDGQCRAHVFALEVTEEMETWPEQGSRERHWLAPENAIASCRHDWMKTVLQQWAVKKHLLPEEEQPQEASLVR